MTESYYTKWEALYRAEQRAWRALLRARLVPGNKLEILKLCERHSRASRRLCEHEKQFKS